MTTGGHPNSTGPLKQPLRLINQFFEICDVNLAFRKSKIICPFIGVSGQPAGIQIGLLNDRKAITSVNAGANPKRDFSYRSNYRYHSFNPSVIFDTVHIQMTVSFEV